MFCRTGWQNTSCRSIGLMGRRLAFRPPRLLCKTATKTRCGAVDCPCRPRNSKGLGVGLPLRLGLRGWGGGSERVGEGGDGWRGRGGGFGEGQAHASLQCSFRDCGILTFRRLSTYSVSLVELGHRMPITSPGSYVMPDPSRDSSMWITLICTVHVKRRGREREGGEGWKEGRRER